MSDWIQVYDCAAFDYGEMSPKDVSLVQIAHSLAALPRYLGHTPVPYTVAEHSVRAWEMARSFFPVIEERYHVRWDMVCFHVLFHDAAEAYMGDVPAPLKNYLREKGGWAEWALLEERIESVIQQHFGAVPIPGNERSFVDVRGWVKFFDFAILEREKNAFYPKRPRPWRTPSLPVLWEALPNEAWDAIGFAPQRGLSDALVLYCANNPVGPDNAWGTTEANLRFLEAALKQGWMPRWTYTEIIREDGR